MYCSYWELYNLLCDAHETDQSANHQHPLIDDPSVITLYFPFADPAFADLANLKSKIWALPFAKLRPQTPSGKILGQRSHGHVASLTRTHDWTREPSRMTIYTSAHLATMVGTMLLSQQPKMLMQPSQARVHRPRASFIARCSAGSSNGINTQQKGDTHPINSN